MSTARWLVAALILAVGLGHAAVSAQVTTADLIGRVTDTSGGVLPGVTITVTHTGTGATRTQTSSDTGDYAFTLLPIGTYAIKVELQGFRSQTAQMTLASGDRTRFDAKLDVGAVSEAIQVVGEAPLLQTDTSSVATLLTSKAALDIPLPERNIYRLIQLTPGATEGAVSSAVNGTRPDEKRQTVGVSINGAREAENNQMIDGADNNQRLIGTAGVRPSVDAIAEVRVTTNAYTAESGRTAGGVINVITKSGTNEFHGSGFEYYRNGKFDERPYFATSDPIRHQNQFGGSLGGALKKNRTFFFADFERYDLKEGQPNLITIPSTAVRNGDFSELLAAGTVIYDPTTNPRTPFPGNIIPANRISPIARAMMALYPLPNMPGTIAANGQTINNYTSVTNRTQVSDTTDIRIDHRFNADNTLFARYSYNGVDTFTPGGCLNTTIGGKSIDPGCVTGNVGGGGAFPGANNTWVHGVQGNYTRIFNSTLVAEVRAGYLNMDMASLPSNEGTNAASLFGIPGANYGPAATGLTSVELPGYVFLGDQGFLPIEYHDRTKQVSGTFTKATGSHAFKGGTGVVIRDFIAIGVGGSPSGTYTFNQQWTSNAGRGGDSIATFLLGYPTAASRNATLAVPDYHTVEPSVFIQDDWRISSWLTSNLGVRYDVYTPLRERHGQISNFDLTTGQLLVPGQNGVGETVGVKTDYSNISPRLGASATLPHRMVLRGAWGLTYFPTNMHSPSQFRNPPFTSNYTANIQATAAAPPNVFLSQGFPEPVPSDARNPVGAIAAMDPNFKSTRTKQFNVVLEKEFGGNVASIGYVGSRTDRFIGGTPGAAGANYNLQPIGTNAQTARPFFATLPGVQAITLRESRWNQWYDAMQLIFQRRYRAGLSLGTHYTFSHAEWSSWLPWDPTPYPNRTASERFRSPYDTRHNYVFTATYELPYHTRSGLGVILADWQVNAAAFWRSGTPFDITNATSRVINGTDRPNLVGDPSLPSGRPLTQQLNQWFNTAAFEAAPLGTLATNMVPRGYLIGPSSKRLDLSFFRDIRFGGTPRAQLQWMIFNVTNTPTFGNPGGALGNANFGVISTTLGIPRQMQFAARFTF